MSGRLQPADAETRARLRTLADRPLPLEEWKRQAAIPLSDDERDRTLELVRWFTRRYPTPAERLAYARQAYRRWTVDTVSRRG
jgi:hypothetical protein